MSGGGGSSKVLEQVEDVEDILAAKAAEKENVQDEEDFDDKMSTHGGGGGGPPETPVVETPREGIVGFPSTSKLVRRSTGTTPVAATATITKEVVMRDAPSPSLLQDTPTQRPMSAHQSLLDQPINNDAHSEVEEEEMEPGHIDDYMLRFVEWELRDVPVGSEILIDRGATGLTARGRARARAKASKKGKGGKRKRGKKSGGGGGGGRTGGSSKKKKSDDGGGGGGVMTRTSSEGGARAGVAPTGSSGWRGRGNGRGAGRGRGSKGRGTSRR